MLQCTSKSRFASDRIRQPVSESIFCCLGNLKGTEIYSLIAMEYGKSKTKYQLLASTESLHLVLYSK